MSTSVTKLLEVAKETGYVHFPQGVMVWRTGSGKWAAEFITKDTQKTSETTAKVELVSPDAALADLEERVLASARSRLSSIEKDAEKLRTAMGAKK